MNPLARFRDWWHAPVSSRLDRIEANTRRETVTVTPNPKVDEQVQDAIARVRENTQRRDDLARANVGKVRLQRTTDDYTIRRSEGPR